MMEVTIIVLVSPAGTGFSMPGPLLTYKYNVHPKKSNNYTYKRLQHFLKTINRVSFINLNMNN